MATQTTQTSIKNGFNNVIKVGYCELQHLLSYAIRNYYTSGTYGWNSDVYIIDNETVVVTGYRPFGNIEPDVELVRRYDKRAEAYNKNTYANYNERKRYLNGLIKEFIEEVTK